MVMDAGLDNTGQDGETWNATGQSSSNHDPSGQAASGHADAGQHAEEQRNGTSLGAHELPHVAEPDVPDLQALARDWITLWQSELSAVAADPEIGESWQTVMVIWAGMMSPGMRGRPREQDTAGYDRTRGRPGADDAPRTPAAPAAPDTRDVEIERLAHHVAALERRLVELERGSDPPVHSKQRAKLGSGRKRRG